MNISNILKRVAKRRNWTGYRYLRRNAGFGTSGLSLSFAWKGKNQAFLGIPRELFEEGGPIGAICGLVGKSLEESQGVAEEKAWEQMFGGGLSGNLAPRKQETIEGFGRFGLAHRIRKNFTRFGSGWQGAEDVMMGQARSPFSIRPYARAIERAHLQRPESLPGKVDEAMTSSFGREAIRPTRRQSLEIAKEAAPFMTTPEVAFAGKGAESDVYRLGSGKVLKLSQPFAEGLGVEELRGTRGILHPGYHQQFEGFEAGIYPEVTPLDTGVAAGSAEFASNERKVTELFQSLHQQGIIWKDPTPRNVGMLGERPVVLDAGKMKRIGEGISTEVAVAKRLAPARAATIEGLAEGGVASAIRKVMTAFGSGFKGNPKPQLGTPQQFLKLSGSTEASIKATDIQHGRYQAGEMEELVQRYKQGLNVDPLEIYLDEFKNIVGVEGRHRAVAAMKAGVKQIPIRIGQRAQESAGVFQDATSVVKSGGASAVGDAAEQYLRQMSGNAAKLTARVMETGEGAAISQAGTSAVRSVFKMGARVIKNAL